MAQVGSYYSGTATNPAANAFVLQTPAIVGGATGTYAKVKYVITNQSSSLQLLNCGAFLANGTIVGVLPVYVPATSTFVLDMGGPYPIPNNLTLGVQATAVVTGIINTAITLTIESNY